MPACPRCNLAQRLLRQSIVGNLLAPDDARPDVIVMFYLRTILASLIALAVAVAPVAAMVVSGGVRTADAAVAHHCHGEVAQSMAGDGDDATLPRQDQHKTSQTAKGSCPDCHGKGQVSCIGDGGKCCKLTGMVAVLPFVTAPAETVDLAASPPRLTGWQMRPSPPPPRA